MKKILLLFIILLCTGCYDYKELNDLALVAGIAVDYTEDDEYLVTFEIINEQKSSESSGDIDYSRYVEGKGKTIADAFNNASFEVAKHPYYTHMKVMIISESIAKDSSTSLINYVLRNPNMTNLFYITIAKDYEASEIIRANNDKNDTISNSIYELLSNNDLGNDISHETKFEDFASKLNNKYEDCFMTSVTLAEDEKIKLKGIAIFEDDKFKEILDYKKSQTINILLNSSSNAYYKKKCDKNDDDKYTIINIYDQKISYKVTKNKATIDISLDAGIIENQCNYDLKDPKTYKKFNRQFEKIFTDDTYDALKTLQENNTDILSINYIYYKDNNAKINFKDLDIKVNVKVNINKNGLTFGVKHDK